MADNFFGLERKQTPTCRRIHNPTISPVGMVLAHRAVRRTINPMYCGSVIRSGAECLRGLIPDCLTRSVDRDSVADSLQRRLTPHPTPLARPPVTKVAGRMDVFRFRESLCGDRYWPYLRMGPPVLALTGSAIAKIPATAAGPAASEPF
jgi:hypothetical protein